MKCKVNINEELFGKELMMEPVMSYSTVAEFAERYDADNAGDQTNFTDFYNMMTKQALPLMQEGTAAAYDEVYALIMKGGYWTKCGWRVDSVQIIKGEGLNIFLSAPKYTFKWLTTNLKNL